MENNEKQREAPAKQVTCPANFSSLSSLPPPRSLYWGIFITGAARARTYLLLAERHLKTHNLEKQMHLAEVWWWHFAVKRRRDVSYGLSMTAHCFWWEVGDDFSFQIKCFEVTVDLHVVVKIIQRESPCTLSPVETFSQPGNRSWG